MAEFTDQEAIAAFNSCIDLNRWKELPPGIQARVRALFQKKYRVGMVCFFSECGFGLRVFQDLKPNEGIAGEEEDIVPEAQEDKVSPMLEDGVWVKCPASKYKAPVPDGEAYLLMDEFGSRFVKFVNNLGVEVGWTFGSNLMGRRAAEKFTKEEAEKLVAFHAAKGLTLIPVLFQVKKKKGVPLQPKDSSPRASLYTRDDEDDEDDDEDDE